MISKAVRRMLAVSLAAVMAIGAAGCGNGGDTTQTPDPTKAPDNAGTTDTKKEETPAAPTEAPVEEVDPEYVVITDENGNPIDLGGMQVIVRDWWGDGSSTDDKLAKAENAYDEARWEYVKWCEETYNFTIIEQAMGDWTSPRFSPYV